MNEIWQDSPALAWAGLLALIVPLWLIVTNTVRDKLWINGVTDQDQWGQRSMGSDSIDRISMKRTTVLVTGRFQFLEEKLVIV